MDHLGVYIVLEVHCLLLSRKEGKGYGVIKPS